MRHPANRHDGRHRHPPPEPELPADSTQPVPHTPPLAIANVNAGKLKGFAVTTAKRMEQLPNVASLSEQGLGDFNESFWYGVVAPAALPANIAEAYDRSVADIARAPALQQSLGRLGCGPLPLNSAEFAARIKSDLTKYSAIAKSVGMKVE
jgi:tripartite-type tricarboxylate transporter receptor subunit TctC